MEYRLIQPPVSVSFREMSKAQIAEYGRWFHAVLPERLEHLFEVVRDDPNSFDWSADLSPESLGPLGEWFETQVETWELTSSELRDVVEAQPFPIEIDGRELTDRTLSLCMDIGMYLGSVMIENVPDTRWDQPLKGMPRSWVDYGRPVIVGLGVVPIEPVGLVQVAAYEIVYDAGRARLEERYSDCLRYAQDQLDRQEELDH